MTNTNRSTDIEAITDDEYDDVCIECRSKCASCGGPIDPLDTVIGEELRQLANTTYGRLTATTVRLFP